MFELLPDGQVRHCSGCPWKVLAHGCIVAHRGHEETEGTAERETNDAGHDGLSGAGFHNHLHLLSLLARDGLEKWKGAHLFYHVGFLHLLRVHAAGHTSTWDTEGHGAPSHTGKIHDVCWVGDGLRCL